MTEPDRATPTLVERLEDYRAYAVAANADASRSKMERDYYAGEAFAFRQAIALVSEAAANRGASQATVSDGAITDAIYGKPNQPIPVEQVARVRALFSAPPRSLPEVTDEMAETVARIFRERGALNDTAGDRFFSITVKIARDALKAVLALFQDVAVTQGASRHLDRLSGSQCSSSTEAPPVTATSGAPDAESEPECPECHHAGFAAFGGRTGKEWYACACGCGNAFHVPSEPASVRLSEAQAPRVDETLERLKMATERAKHTAEDSTLDLAVRGLAMDVHYGFSALIAERENPTK